MAAWPGRSGRSPRRPPTKRDSPLASSSSTDRVLVGRVGRPHGTRGYVVVHSESDHPGRFRPGSKVLGPPDRVLVVGDVKATSGPLLVRFQGISDRTSAEELRGAELTIEAGSRRPLEAGEFWPDELVGLEIRDPAGRRRGIVVDVVEGAAQERLVVETVEGRTVEIPFVLDLVPTVDPQAGFLVVAPIDGLL